MPDLKFFALYRHILRLHQAKLPDVPRQLGDRYVRQEFRAHLKVKKEEEKQFMTQWEDYAAHLNFEADIFGIGRDLADSDVENLSADQKAQLDRLHHSARSIGIKQQTEAGENPFHPDRTK